jgi:hypothetical protein
MVPPLADIATEMASEPSRLSRKMSVDQTDEQSATAWSSCTAVFFPGEQGAPMCVFVTASLT